MWNVVQYVQVKVKRSLIKEVNKQQENPLLTCNKHSTATLKSTYMIYNSSKTADLIKQFITYSKHYNSDNFIRVRQFHSLKHDRKDNINLQTHVCTPFSLKHCVKHRREPINPSAVSYFTTYLRSTCATRICVCHISVRSFKSCHRRVTPLSVKHVLKPCLNIKKEIYFDVTVPVSDGKN